MSSRRSAPNRRANPRRARWRPAVVAAATWLVASWLAPAAAYACAPARTSALIEGDAIDHITLAASPRKLYVHMTSGVMYCYPLFASAELPPRGDAYRGTKDGLALTITGTRTGYSARILLQGRRKWVEQAWRRLRARGSFPVDVIGGGSPPQGSEAGRRASSRGSKASRRGKARAKASRDAAAEAIRALAAQGLPVDVAERIAGKLENDATLTAEEAEALLALFGRVVLDEQADASMLLVDQQGWLEWARRYAADPRRFSGPLRFGKDRVARRDVERILAEHKQYVGIVDPPTVTARQRRKQVEYDPELRRSWNGLARWERDLWRAWWKRRPGGAESGSENLSMTPEVRFRMALSMSPDYMRAGARDAARALFEDPVFQVATMASITLYVVAWLNPEPLVSKLTAATITAGLLTMFSYSEIENLLTAWFRTRELAERAQTIEELDAAAQVFGEAVGGTGLRVLLALFTCFAGKALPAPKPGVAAPPGAPAVATPGGAMVATARSFAIQGAGVSVLADGSVRLSPIIASVAAGGGAGGGGSGSSGSGQAATPKAPSAEGTRAPTDSAGTWIGDRGHGTFTPKGTSWKIPFRRGRPDFRDFVQKGHTFDKVPGLTGKGDRSVMLKTIIDKIGTKYGFTTQQEAQAWLNGYKTQYGRGLELHHSAPGQFQLVPKPVHNAAQHGGFPGSASQLRTRRNR